MNVKPENLKRALAILWTEPNDLEIECGGHTISVAGQHLDLQAPDDLEVLSVLMSNKEFGFAASIFEETAATMRKLQEVWCDAADAMKIKVAT